MDKLAIIRRHNHLPNTVNLRPFVCTALAMLSLAAPQVFSTETNAVKALADIPQATTEFRAKQTDLSDLPIPDAEAPRFSRAPRPTQVSPYHTVVMEQYAPPVRARGGSAYFKISHYTLSFDGRQLLVETYRLAAPSSSVNISHTTRVLRSEIPYQFREGRELLRFGMDEEGMKILRFERYTINPTTGEATISQTHYPVENPL